MIPRRAGAALALLALVLAPAGPAAADEVDARVERILGAMTLEEKAAQLDVISRGTRFDPAQLAEVGAGAVMNVKLVPEIAALVALGRASRLGVPPLVGLDVVHGFRTMFPVPLAEAASFDPDLAREAARLQAVEARAAGITWTFAPAMDVARDPRWGRIVEGAGEDPWLGERFAGARVEGLRAGGLIATAKHFAGYGAVLGGRDYDETDVPPAQMRDVHLPPFRAAVRAGLDSVMTSLTANDGVPAAADRGLLTDVLRGEWGFRGPVVADWNAVDELIAHGVARDEPDAARTALAAGVDLDMASGLYRRILPDEVRAGRVPGARLDAAVRRVLRLKARRGLLDAGPPRVEEAEAAQLRPEARALARAVARRSLVLLKNGGKDGGKDGGPLPIDPGRVRRIALVGPLAEAPADQIGPHQGDGRPEETITLRAGLAERAARAGVAFEYARGCTLFCRTDEGFPDAVAAAERADLVVAVVGEPRFLSGEDASRARLDLPGRQRDLVAALARAGRPLVLVLMAGRPLELPPDLLEAAGAVMMAWYPGTEGGPALAEVLFGDDDPGGRLPITWPRSLGQVPLTYDERPSGRPTRTDVRFTRGYRDESTEPLFPFGHGLSYADVRIGDPRIATPRLAPGQPLRVEVEVSNRSPAVGGRPGRGVVQLYVRQPVARRSRPLRLLKAAAALSLAPGETRTVTLEVPFTELGYHEPDGTLVVEPGAFEAYVGGDSRAAARADFAVAEPGLRRPAAPPPE